MPIKIVPKRIVGIVTINRNNEPNNKIIKVNISDRLKPNRFKTADAKLEKSMNITNGNVVKIPKLPVDVPSCRAKSPIINGIVVIGERIIDPIKITDAIIPTVTQVLFFEFKI